MRVTVWLNEAEDEWGRKTAMFYGFSPDDPLREAFRMDVGECDTSRGALGTVWELLNIGDDPVFYDPPDPRAVEYRRRRNRRLSVGDVLELGNGAWFACDRQGWTLLSTVSELV